MPQLNEEVNENEEMYISQEEMDAIEKDLAENPPEEDHGMQELTREEVKKAQKKDKEDRILKKEIYNILVRAMTGKFLPPSDWPKFPTKFATVKNGDGSLRFSMIDDREVVTYISPELIKNTVLSYVKNNKKHGHKINLKNNDLTEVVRLFQALSEPLDVEKVSPIRQKSTPGLCWHRLDWDLEEGPTPLFDELCSRTSNNESFQCWIGSLFYPQADRQTYLWLYGGGKNGKGTLCRMLARIFGPGYSSEQVPTQAEARFWSMGLLGKRLVAFPDCNHTSFTKSGLIKSVTGGDKVRVEFKGGGISSEPLTCMLLILSNNKPQLSRQESDMRRAIFCEMGPIVTDFGGNYEQLLWEEAKHFIHKCMMLYREKYPNYTAIRPDREINTLLASQADGYFEDIFDKHFRSEQGAMVMADEVRRILRDEKMDEIKARYFCQWMEHNCNVTYKLVRTKDNWKIRRYAYMGMRKKNTHDDIMELDFSDND